MANQAQVYTFDDMIASLRQAMIGFPDIRTGKNTQYEVPDAASCAFSVFFTQCPSFLSFQRLMEQKHGSSNAKTLFGVKRIPGDNQIRNLLDTVNPGYLSPVFTDCFNALKRSGDLDTYRVGLGENKRDILIALDGTTYHSSGDISCGNCSIKVKDGETIYSQAMITPTVVAPGQSKVISLMPEFITPQDGDVKQDCEIKAGKRWLNRQDNLGEVTLLGDDLYSHEPFCRDILEKQCNFIFVCKPDSHKTLYEWIKGITQKKVEDRFDGKKHQIYTYEYIEGVPIRDGKDVLAINFVEVTVTDRQTGKQLYHNAFITNHSLSEETLGTIIDCGRARWKIENENNNTLKTQGYHLEHNFGHGKKYLSAILAAMNILAFLFHTMLEFMDRKYRLLRKIIGARKHFFNDIRACLKLWYFRSFDSLMDFILEGLNKPHDPDKIHFPL
jgi:hypothetical protein